MLHVTSLPGGRLGPEAYRFVDWLRAAGQTWWQVLPLGPPDDEGSPYMASSAFAAWPRLLGSPRARVTPAEAAAFREREAYWIEGWARLGRSYMVLNEPQKARDAYAHAVKLKPDDTALKEAFEAAQSAAAKTESGAK